MTSPTSEAAALLVPFSRVSTFVRQVTHDIRNNLNAVDLQAAYVLELVNDPEAADEVKRIRTLVQQTARQLQALSGNFWTAQPNLISYPANIFVEDFKDRLTKAFPENASQVQWSEQLGQEEINVDIEMLFSALSELFRNAFQFRENGQPISAEARVEDGHFVLELREGKHEVATPPERWGLEPFVSSRRGGYGLGLYRARNLLAAQEGTIEFSHDSGSALLRTRVLLPLAATA